MKSVRIRPFPEIELAAMLTKQLLARLERLRALGNSRATSDGDVRDDAEADPAQIYFKDDPRWAAELEKVQTILARRGHVFSGAETSQLRQLAATKANRAPKPRPRSTGNR